MSHHMFEMTALNNVLHNQIDKTYFYNEEEDRNAKIMEYITKNITERPVILIDERITADF